MICDSDEEEGRGHCSHKLGENSEGGSSAGSMDQVGSSYGYSFLQVGSSL